jgi:N-acetylneuraminate synthase
MPATCPLVIAEAGVNHNGDLERALAMVAAAADAGADVVKFQTFIPEQVISRHAPKADYQKDSTGTAGSQLDMVRPLQLDLDAHRTLMAACRDRGIAFLSTPFDLPSIDLLAGSLGLQRLKLPSGEITNAPYLLAAARTGCDVILSTGMATLGEVEEALGILAFGFLHPTGQPTLAACRDAFASASGQAILRQKVILLHCTTEYPAPVDEVNLRAMVTMQQAFGLPVGLSDHTMGIAVPMGAVALGAVVIEKHFTLDRSLPGPDHQASLLPTELAALVRGVRDVAAALGQPVKAPTEAERKNIPIARKSLVAASAIRAGEPFTPANLAVKRPGSGISPLRYWEYLGRPAARDYADDDLIE